MYPPISAINGGPTLHPNCVDVPAPLVDLSAGRKAERLATEEEKKAGIVPPEMLNRTPAELQQSYRKEYPQRGRGSQV